MTAGALRRTALGWVALATWGIPAAPATVRAQPPRPSGPPTALRTAVPADTSRDGLDADPDPVGAVIERRGLLGLTDAQFAALRDLRRWHQRTQRIVRDSLERLGAPSPATTPRPGASDARPAAAHEDARGLRDSARVWTGMARDSARALLTPAQRDTLAAVWQRYRDSLPARQRPGRQRPPR